MRSTKTASGAFFSSSGTFISFCDSNICAHNNEVFQRARFDPWANTSKEANMFSKQFTRAGVIATTIAGASIAMAGIANAAPGGLYVDEIQNGVRNPNPISECRADGSTCTIASGKSVSSSISGNLGIGIGVINASLGTSYQETYTVDTSCTSPTLKKGEVFTMYPRGDFLFIRNDSGTKGTAFIPTGVFCMVESEW